VGALILALTLGFVLTRTLTRLYEQVRVAVRAREDVLAVVSHDLRNPLGTVMLSSSMLLKNTELPAEPRHKLIRTIYTSGNQMKRLIEDLLDFVKVESGRLSVTKKPEDPVSLLGDVHTVFQPLAKEKGLAFEYSIDPAVTSIECEKARIAQVLSNLLGNAIKFTPRGGSIRLHVTALGGDTLFWVRDTGPGIAPEKLPHVFDRYWQAEGAAREGVGLGLAIVKGLVEAHGGRIWVESLVGAGTTFFFTIPAPGFVEGLRTAIRRPGRDAREMDSRKG
jgi:signal transduction histidine kinase